MQDGRQQCLLWMGICVCVAGLVDAAGKESCRRAAVCFCAAECSWVRHRRAIREALQAAAPGEDGGDRASLLGGAAGEVAVADDDVEAAGAKAAPERRGSGFPSFSSL